MLLSIGLLQPPEGGDKVVAQTSVLIRRLPLNDVSAEKRRIASSGAPPARRRRKVEFMSGLPHAQKSGMRKRRQHSAAFKARVVLEAVTGLMWGNEIDLEHEVHPVEVSPWNRDLAVRLPEVFGREPGLEAKWLVR